ncbi:MAG: hypothetical protein ACREQ9_19085 [Candidatus Binatia bacterium]
MQRNRFARGRRPTILLAALGLAALLSARCGGDGGGGSGSSTIDGNVSQAPSAAVDPTPRSWLAWIGEEVVGLAKRAIAQGRGLEGIRVTARRGGAEASDVTDGNGAFDLGGAPTGDVTVSFEQGNCSADGSLPDVAASSTITLADVDISDCDDARPGSVAESFVAVVQNKPASPNGNLNVCVNSGGEIRTRVVKLQNAAFEDGGSGKDSFQELAEGDRIEAIGEREGLGAPSALDADVVRILATDEPGDCAALVEPTATPTEPAPETPTPTETPGE